MSESLTDAQVAEIFEACAKMALCYPWRLTDPLGVYSQLGFADQSERMHARLYRAWLGKVHDYPWYLDRRSIQNFIDKHDPIEEDKDA